MLYQVKIDENSVYQVEAASLAALANQIRGKARNRVRVWNLNGMCLVDTNLGDPYDLIYRIKPEEKEGTIFP